MTSLQVFSGTATDQTPPQSCPERLEYLTTVMPLFATIPPERVGLNGEYDHNGLAKRVILAFREHFSSEDISSLRVTQRGRVVILMGEVSSKRLLTRLVNLAMQIDGATYVETCGVSIKDNLQSCAAKLAS
jgi:hypothetical protein